MGAQLLKEPRVCLEKENVTGLAIYLFGLTLTEVAAMISCWERAGAPLVLDIELFSRVFGCKLRKGVLGAAAASTE